MRRVTDAASRIIYGEHDQTQDYSLCPHQPSYWTNAAHLVTLLRTWDAMRGVQLPNDAHGHRARRAKIASTLRRIARAFPELTHGDVKITREWVHIVLENNLRFEPARSSYWIDLNVSNASGISRGWGPW